MEIQVQEIEPCKLSINYTSESEDVSAKQAEVITVFKKAPVPGNRPGKASPQAIAIHYRKQIEDALKRAMAEEAFHNTIFEKGLKPHGSPKFNSMLLVDGKFKCQFDLYTKPDFTLAPYQDLQIPKPPQTETATELAEKMLQDLRIKLGDISPYTEDDFVQTGDSIIVDYESFIDNQKIDKLSATGQMLTIGSSNIAQFDDNLLGMKIGETREFDLQVPDTGLPSIAGKNVHMKVSLSMGSKTIPNPLNDTLATKIGKKDLNELRELVSGTATANLQSKLRAKIAEAVGAKLVQDNTINVPNWMSLSEAQYLVQQSKLDWNALEDQDKEQYLQVAEKNVKLSLILEKIRDENVEAQMSDQEVFEVVKDNLVKTKVTQPLDEVIQQMSKTGYLQILFARIRDEYTLDFICKKVSLIE